MRVHVSSVFERDHILTHTSTYVPIYIYIYDFQNTAKSFQTSRIKSLAKNKYMCVRAHLWDDFGSKIAATVTFSRKYVPRISCQKRFTALYYILYRRTPSAPSTTYPRTDDVCQWLSNVVRYLVYIIYVPKLCMICRDWSN